jgi:Cys-tRNA(Pro)/Cys-tRNA(Cys) deacylase
MIVNNVTRLLDKKKIPYHVFELPNEKLGAEETARILGVESKQVYKTIVITRPVKGKPILALIPGDSKVDIKKLALGLKEKKLVIPTEKEAEFLTGLQAGGISPLSLLNKGFQVIIDEAALSYEEIHISGGQRGLNIRISVNDLVSLTSARIFSISFT